MAGRVERLALAETITFSGSLDGDRRESFYFAAVVANGWGDPWQDAPATSGKPYSVVPSHDTVWVSPQNVSLPALGKVTCKVQTISSRERNCAQVL